VTESASSARARATVGAIVLAGGRSSRFGRDKLAELVHGRPLLELAIEAVRAVTDDIVVMIASDGGPLAPRNVRVVRDERPFEGPLVALGAGLAASTADRVIVVAGDMPNLLPAVLRRMVDALDDGRIDAVILETPGRPALLPMVLRRTAARPVAERLIAAGMRRLGALPDALGTSLLAAAAWRLDDPEGGTLRDVDTEGDLA